VQRQEGGNEEGSRVSADVEKASLFLMARDKQNACCVLFTWV
jgi:hypothetical protein